MDPSLGHGQHPRQRGHHEILFPTRRTVLPPTTKHVVLAALRRGRLPQLSELHPDASERHSCPLRPRWHLRRVGHEQSMAAPVFGRTRAVTDLCEKNQPWTTGCRRLRADSDDDFRGALEQVNELHATGDLFAKHIEPEPAPEDPVDWAMAEASVDEDDALMPDAPPEPEIVDMPPAPASERPMSNLERCIALRFVYGAGPC